MKRVIAVIGVGALVLVAGSVLAADSFTAGTAGNIQEQVQSIGAVDLGANGGLSGLEQTQGGLGGSAALPGSAGAEGQMQGENTTITGTNGFATHSYDSTVVSEGGSITLGGAAVHAEGQNLSAGIATEGDGNGTASISGSAMQIDQGVIAGSTGLSAAEAGVGANFNSEYEYTNTGTNSQIVQTGEQHSIMATGVGTVGNAGAGAGLEAVQIGGTAAGNDGNGTSMGGAGAAAGSITTGNEVIAGPGSAAAAGSIGVQSQTHSYEQTASNGAQSQWASGTVSTGNAVADGVVILP